MLARSMLALCIQLAMLSLPARAQQLEPGVRVRGETSHARFDGRLIWVSADSLAVFRDGTPAIHRRSEITRLEVGSGSRRNTVLGLGIGAGVGAVGGLVILSLHDGDAPPSELDDLRYGYAGLFFVGATAVGGIVGALVKTPRWVRLQPDGVGVSIDF